MAEKRSGKSGVAAAEARFQMTRPLARTLTANMTPYQKSVMGALLFNAALNAIEAWEKGRPVREAEEFYGQAKSEGR